MISTKKKHLISRRYIPLALSAIAIALTSTSATSALTAPPSYGSTVEPILRRACISCHSAAGPSGGFSVASGADFLKGGKHGAVLVAGKGAQSRVTRMLLGTLSPKMPPNGQLKPEEIAAIRAWIDQGAHVTTAALKSNATATITRPIGKTIAVAAPVTSLAFSPDGTTLAIGVYREVQFWSIRASAPALTTNWKGHLDTIRSLAYSRDGALLAAGGGMPGVAGEVRIRDIATGKECSVLGEHTDVVNGLAFSPDAHRLATGSADKSVRIWEIPSGKQTALMRDHSEAVLGMCWSPDGKVAASCGADASIKIWDPVAGKRIYSISAHDGPINSIQFSPDGKGLLTCGADKTARQWNYGADSSSQARVLSGHTMYVLSGAYSPDGKLAASCSSDGTVSIWKVADGSRLAVLKDAADWLYCVGFSPDSKQVAAGCWNGDVLIWDAADYKLLKRFSTAPLRRPVGTLANIKQ